MSKEDQICTNEGPVHLHKGKTIDFYAVSVYAKRLLTCNQRSRANGRFVKELPMSKNIKYPLTSTQTNSYNFGYLRLKFQYLSEVLRNFWGLQYMYFRINVYLAFIVHSVYGTYTR